MVGGGVGGLRGSVRGFTKASRHRMLQFFQTIDREKCGMPLFVTLTYPGEWPGNAKWWKRDLEVWLARLKRARPGAWAVWRLEPQRRGAPHYHLLVFGLAVLAKEWLSRTWFEVVGSGDQRHLRAGTQVQRVESWRRVIGYAAKYLANREKDRRYGKAFQHRLADAQTVLDRVDTVTANAARKDAARAAILSDSTSAL